jgi:serine/threonine-protein kinase
VKLAGRYELAESIGSGGMGVVLRARDERLGREVAVKILPPDRVGDATARRRLVREARAAAALQHSGIVHVYDVGETDEGGAYLVMELVKGTSLRQALEGQAASLQTRLRYVVEAARALAFAHERGIVHRDVKPDNIMIREDGRVCLLDFGLAKPVLGQGASTVLSEGGIIGTPAYIAPEQAAGAEVDARADQFSLGVTAYEALAGRVPWNATSLAHMIAAILRDDPPPLSSIHPLLPRELDAPLARAMAKRPEDRFPSVADFGDALAGVANRLDAASLAAAPTQLLPTSAPDLTPPRTRAELVAETRTAPGRRRRAAAVLAGAAAAIALAASGIVAAVTLSRRSPPAPAAATIESGAARRPVATTDLPIPESKVPAAMAAYRMGMQAFRDGSIAAMRVAFQRAAELDPAYAAAHYRLGVVALGQGDMALARTELASAMSLRSTLPPREGELLAAAEPLVLRSPPDFAAAEARIRALTDREPLDAELRALLAYVEIVEHDQLGALGDSRRALELDPQYGFAYMLEGWGLAELGRRDEERQAYDQCVEHVPAAIVCLGERAGVLAEAGECAQLAADAERIIAAAPEAATGYAYRTAALLARSAPRETVEDAAKQAADAQPGEARAVQSAINEEAIAMAFGDFLAVQRAAGETEKTLSHTTDLAPHSAHALALAEAFIESGRTGDAARVALAYLRKRDLWVANAVEQGPESDATPRLVAIARRAGAMTPDAARRERESFVRRWSSLDHSHDAPQRVWLSAYAGASTSEDADEAAAAMPADMPKAPATAAARAALGEVLRLKGALGDALPLLESASRACMTIEDPPWHVFAAMHLAEARETNGDSAGACEAYRAVLDRWGGAKPRSTTAEAARARVRTLGCK